MAGQNPHLWRSQLCAHGPTCSRYAAGTCGFAHSLAGLLPPDEYFQTYDGVWSDVVDRWYGQQMTQHQVDRIRRYYWDTPELERPVWDKALWWYCTGAHPEM